MLTHWRLATIDESGSLKLLVQNHYLHPAVFGAAFRCFVPRDRFIGSVAFNHKSCFREPLTLRQDLQQSRAACGCQIPIVAKPLRVDWSRVGVSDKSDLIGHCIQEISNRLDLGQGTAVHGILTLSK